MSGAGPGGGSIADLQTPTLLLDRARFERNVERMEARCSRLGVRLRTHLKTAKSAEVARRIPSVGDHGATVSTVKEAEYFARNGVDDLLYAVTVTADKLPRLAAVRRGGSNVRLAADCAETVDAILAFAAREHVGFEVLIEVDSGEHRSGLAPDDPAIVALAQRLHRGPMVGFGGVFTHAGHGYDCRDAAALQQVAEDERRAVVDVAERLRAAGLPVGIVSVGSTPTVMHARHLDGVTEARAGVFVFGDLFQARIGGCAFDDIATSVLTTVIGRQHRHGRVLVDAGGLALSKDRSTAALGPDGDAGYGLVLDLDGRVLPGLRVAHAYQEHGILETTGPTLLDELVVGRKLRILPNHACMTCSAYDRYQVIERGRVVDVWPRIHEWV